MQAVKSTAKRSKRFKCFGRKFSKKKTLYFVGTVLAVLSTAAALGIMGGLGVFTPSSSSSEEPAVLTPIPLPVDPTCAFTLPPNALPGNCTTRIADGAFCVIRCASGYNVTSTATVCAKGQLTQQTCRLFPLPCSIPLPLNGNRGTCASQIAPSASCSIACNTGYDRIGSSTVCGSSGTNLTSSQSCSARSCSLQVPLNGLRGGCPSVLPSGGVCGIACNQNFTVQGEQMACNLGVLTSVQSCVPISTATYCLIPSIEGGDFGSCNQTREIITNVLFGPQLATVLPVGETCNINCRPGFNKTRSLTTCVQGNLLLQSCLLPGCVVNRPSHGSLGSCSPLLNSGAECSIACDTGYGIRNLTTMCSSSYDSPGVLTSIQSCHPNSCQVPFSTSVFGGSFPFDGNTILTSGAEFQLNCRANFERVGEVSNCTAGTFYLQTCKSIGCAIEAPLNGNINCSSPVLEEGKTCRSTCSSGYEIQPSALISCYGGELFPASQLCVERTCNMTQYVLSRDGFEMGNCPGTLNPGSSCTPTCKSNFLPSPLPLQSAACTLGSVQHEQSCLSLCSVPIPAFGTRGTCTGTLTEGSSCTISCDGLYSANGTATICGANHILTSTQSCVPLRENTCIRNASEPQSLWVRFADATFRTNFARPTYRQFEYSQSGSLQTRIESYDIRKTPTSLALSRDMFAWSNARASFYPVGSEGFRTCFTAEKINNLAVMREWTEMPTCDLLSINTATLSSSMNFTQTFGWAELIPDCSANSCISNGIAPPVFYSKLRTLHTLWNNIAVSTTRNRCSTGTAVQASTFYTSPQNAWKTPVALGSSYSVSLWFRADTLPSTQVLMGCSDCTVANGLHYLRIVVFSDVGGTVSYRIVAGHASGNSAMEFIGNVMRNGGHLAGHSSVISNSTIQINRWYHVVVTYASSTQLLTMYVDGVLEAQFASLLHWVPLVAEVPSSVVQLFSASTSQAYSYLGQNYTDNGASLAQFRGHLADLGIWRSALSQSEAQLLYSDPAF